MQTAFATKSVFAMQHKLKTVAVELSATPIPKPRNEVYTTAKLIKGVVSCVGTGVPAILSMV